MKRRYRTGQTENLFTLSPWQTELEQSFINNYCTDFMDPWRFIKKDKNLPKIKDKKRAVSTCTNIHKKQKTQLSQIEKVKSLKPAFEVQLQNQKHFHTISQNRTQRPQKKKSEKLNVLQQVSVKNFIIEGGQSMQKEKMLKKRESSYVLKQKFAQLRRSMKEVGVQNKQNMNLRVIRYEN